LLGASYTAGFFLTLVLVNSRGRLTQLLWLLVLSGSFQAVYGTLMVLSGLEWGFFVEKYVGRGVTTGTFVNRNHLAGYLVMCLAAGTGLLYAQISSAPGASARVRERLRRWLRLLLSSRLRLRVLLALMVIALVLTRSRMGNAAFFISLLFAGAMVQYAGQYFSRRLALLLLSLVIVDMVILSRWFGFDRLLDRLGSTEVQTEARTANLPQLLEYARDFWFTGSGGGSFYGVFPRYQEAATEVVYLHAHNDYLQFLGELGLPGVLLLAAFVALALRSALTILRSRQSRLFHGVAFAVLMTIVWALLHASVDFNLQIPANAFTFVVLLALAWVARVLPRRPPQPRPL
jgi:O-antigen ligase